MMMLNADDYDGIWPVAALVSARVRAPLVIVTTNHTIVLHSYPHPSREVQAYESSQPSKQ